MPRKKFIIIDANSLIHRAFHALPPLATKDGTLVNAVYGFATILLKALKEFKPDYIACCFDVDKDTFRKKEYDEYKAHREEQPSELYHQFPLIKDLLEAFKIPVYEKQGYEADDVIGTIASKKNKDVKNIIVSGDLDILQLIDNNTKVYTLKRGISDTVIYDEAAVKERYGFGPEQLIDFKALAGDASDNIPGVKGVGEKTAGDLIKKYGSLEKLYKFVDGIKDAEKEIEKSRVLGRKGEIKSSVFNKLKQDKKQAFLSKKLATIVRNVKFEFDLRDTKVEAFDTQAVLKLFQAWNFTSLISKIPNAEKVMREKQGNLFDQNPKHPSAPLRAGNKQNTKDEEKFKIRKGYHLISGKESLDDFLKKLKKLASSSTSRSGQKEFAFDTETDGLNPFRNNLIGMSFSWQKGEAWYLPVGNRQGELGEVKQILEDDKIKKIGHNIKFDLEVLDKAGIKLQGLAFDTMIASYLLNPGTRQHNLDSLAFTELSYKTQNIQEVSGEKDKAKINLAEVDVELVANYACEDADITWQLYHKLSEKLDDATIEGVLEKMEMPLISVLAEMEKNGVLLDINFLKKMSKNLESRILNLESRIYKTAGKKFNVASPLQLKEILFDKLKISTAGLGRTKTGISTAAGELEKMRGRHKIIEMIMEFREISKLKNTYLDPLPELVDENNRVHTSFNQTVTATGRLSSSDPNLQNIPIRTELGREIRKAFVAQRGYQMLAADYSQIELRIVASLANDKKMLAAFDKKEDIHTQTAAEIFDIKPDKVTKEQRRQAKAINFGVIYGLGPRGLAAGTGISYEQAQDFIDRYFDVFDGVKNYIEETIALAHELGYVETLFGRRRYLPEINANHQQMRAQAERMAVNHPVQGTAADLMKLAMIEVDKKIKKEFADGEVKMLLQVHDELVFEVKNDLVAHASKIIKQEMESVYKLKAPIEVEIESGKSWGECK